MESETKAYPATNQIAPNQYTACLRASSTLCMTTPASAEGASATQGKMP